MTYRTPRTVASDELVQIAELGRPLSDAADLIPLTTSIGNSRFVLPGEASHGTHEYHEWRAVLTKETEALNPLVVAPVGEESETYPWSL